MDDEQQQSDKAARQQALERRVRQLEGLWLREHKAAESSRRQLRRRVVVQDLARDPGDEDSWLTVYLDMLTLLLVLLVVMLAFAGKGPQQRLQELLGQAPVVTAVPPPAEEPAEADGEPRPENPLAGLDTSGLGKDIEVIVNQSSVSFRISSEIIFPPADAELSLAGLQVLQRLIPVLTSSDHRITVVGHTDSLPINTRRFPSNWELSGARAGSVVRYLEANGIDSARLSAVGHADTRPLAPNSTPDGRAQNRRVELILEKPAP